MIYFTEKISNFSETTSLIRLDRSRNLNLEITTLYNKKEIWDNVNWLIQEFYTSLKPSEHICDILVKRVTLTELAKDYGKTVEEIETWFKKEQVYEIFQEAIALGWFKKQEVFPPVQI